VLTAAQSLRQISPHAWVVRHVSLLPSLPSQGRESVRGQAFFYSETGYQTTVDVVALAIRQGVMELPVLPVAFIIPRDTLLAIVYTRGEASR
jgi:hypothetical protein